MRDFPSPDRFLSRVPSPLEIAGGGLDTVAEVVQLPGRAVGNVLGAGERAVGQVVGAIERPKGYGDMPAPPDVVVEGALDAVTGVASSVIEGVGGVFNAVQDTGDGIRRNIDRVVRRY
jgi:hypothetical protein